MTFRFASVGAVGALSLLAGSAWAFGPGDENRLLPFPRDLRWGSDEATLGGQVAVVGAQTHPSAYRVVAAALKSVGATAVPVQSIPTGKPVVILGRENAAPVDFAANRTAANFTPEGYVLRVSNVDGAPRVVLAGSGTAGTFYAAQTLRQMLELGSKLHAVTVWDYPAFTKERGYGEFFYGRPWSHDERKAAIQFMGEVKLNLYMYSPKDDPYNRDKWREDYPPIEMKRIQELIDLGKGQFVTFSWAMSPGLSIEYSGDKDFATLMRKFHQVRKMGARNISLQLDDIPSEMFHPQDRKRFKDVGQAHAFLANRVFHDLLKADKTIGFSYCPVKYYIAEPDAYLKSMGAKLDPRIPTMWTGADVCDRDITLDKIYAYASGIRRKPFFSDNYPVNDYCTARLQMGPLTSRSHEIVAHLYEGFLENPMNQEEASKVALATIADWAWNPYAYDAERSWRNALRVVGGDKGYAALRLFCEQCQSSFLQPKESHELNALIDDYLASPSPMTEKALRALLEGFAAIDVSLNQTVENRALLKEIEPWVAKLALYGKAGLIWLDKQTEPNGAAEASLKDCKAKLKAMPQEICGGAMERLIGSL